MSNSAIMQLLAQAEGALSALNSGSGSTFSVQGNIYFAVAPGDLPVQSLLAFNSLNFLPNDAGQGLWYGNIVSAVVFLIDDPTQNPHQDTLIVGIQESNASGNATTNAGNPANPSGGNPSTGSTDSGSNPDSGGGTDFSSGGSPNGDGSSVDGFPDDSSTLAHNLASRSAKLVANGYWRSGQRGRILHSRTATVVKDSCDVDPTNPDCTETDPNGDSGGGSPTDGSGSDPNSGTGTTGNPTPAAGTPAPTSSGPQYTFYTFTGQGTVSDGNFEADMSGGNTSGGNTGTIVLKSADVDSNGNLLSSIQLLLYDDADGTGNDFEGKFSVLNYIPQSQPTQQSQSQPQQPQPQQPQP